MDDLDKPDPTREQFERMSDSRAPDLSRFRAAVRLRDRCREAAMAYHERCGLTPSAVYANATFDAIIDLIREDESTIRVVAEGLGVHLD